MNLSCKNAGNLRLKFQVSVRVYEELNDYLPQNKRKKEFFITLEPSQTIIDVIHALAIPDDVVDLVLVNGRSVSFSCLLKDGDRISVYPQFESFDISTVTKLRPTPLRHLDFILDVHLGKLARYLRMLGFDTLYQNDFTDHEIVLLSGETGRVILTRDRALLNVSQVTRGYLIKNTDLTLQIREVVNRFQLSSLVKPFTRCLSCNSNVEKIEKAAVKEKLDPELYDRYNAFSCCTGCGKIFWKGSHYLSMNRFLQELGGKWVKKAC